MADNSQENWSININLTAGVAPSGVAQGYLPRGIYQCVTTKVSYDTTDKSEHLTFKALVQVGYIVQEDGTFKHDTKIGAQKREITKLIFLKGTEDWQVEQREKDIKASLVSHGRMTRQQAIDYNGGLALNPSAYVNQPCFIAFDPPPTGAGPKDGAEIRWLEAETARKIYSGEAAIQWPWDRKTPRGESDAAAGNGQAQTSAGSMLAGALPTAGLPGGVPQPRPVAAPVNTAPAAAPQAPAFGGFGGGAPAVNGAGAPAPAFGGFTPGAPTQSWG